MSSFDIQLIPGQDDWSRLREASLAVDEGSYGALWVCDHLAGYSMSSGEMHEAFAWLGALAEATRRVELGVLVVNAHNRTPATTLVAAATIARLSGRTFHLGLGAGTSPTSPFGREQHATSTPIASPMAARHARVEEVLDLADRCGVPTEMRTSPPSRTWSTGRGSSSVSTVLRSLESQEPEPMAST